jgi:predicted nucleotidyltransferase
VTNTAITQTILTKLDVIEKEHSVKILYALESGSRAWGFESTDSDYDARFIYAHPKDWYLNILPKRDVIEYAIVDEFDYSGWDLRKSLFLMNKSNPVLFEWLNAPIVYYKNESAYNVLKTLSTAYFSPISSVYHYLHMASGNFRQYLQADKIKVKKYFYVLRPLLAALWIEKYNETPPVLFETLIGQLSDERIVEPVKRLLERKRTGVEFDLEPKIEALNTFISVTIKHLEEVAGSFNPRKKPEQDKMEKVFVEILNEITW